MFLVCAKGLCCMAAQVQGLRKAFSTLSDVLIEEVDVIRSEAAERQNEVQKQMAGQAKALKAVRRGPVACPRDSTAKGHGALYSRARRSRPS